MTTMNGSKRPHPATRRDDLVLGAVTVCLVVIADQLRGWPALVLAVLAAGAAFGLLAGSFFDMPTVRRVPTHDGIHRPTRRAA